MTLSAVVGEMFIGDLDFMLSSSAHTIGGRSSGNRPGNGVASWVPCDGPGFELAAEVGSTVAFTWSLGAVAD
jgi:hypothetical protein